MITLAFTLGIFGSLHCLGMCGPIAMGLTPAGTSSSGLSTFISALQYNLGRTLSYAGLGMLAGLAGTTIVWSGFQKTGSITMGIFFVILFFLSMDIDQFFGRVPYLRKALNLYRKAISRVFTPGLFKKSWLLGVFNGLLPCGLVYLALAGALLQDDFLQSILFMVFFGLGTIPALTILIFSGNLLKGRWNGIYRRFLPYVQLFLGILLIMRGLNVVVPEEIDFYLGLRNQPMCH